MIIYLVTEDVLHTESREKKHSFDDLGKVEKRLRLGDRLAPLRNGSPFSLEVARKEELRQRTLSVFGSSERNRLSLLSFLPRPKFGGPALEEPRGRGVLLFSPLNELLNC